LVVARGLGIQDPAGNIQVRLGIAVIEQAALGAKKRDGAGDGQRGQRNRRQRAAPRVRLQN